MFLASSNLHLAGAVFEESLIGALEPICHLGEDGSADMTDIQIVDMPHNGELFSLMYGLVCNTGIVGIDFEYDRLFQVFDKALTIKESGLHDAIQCVEETNVENFFALLVDDDIFGIDLQCDFDHKLGELAAESHDGFVLVGFKASLDKRVRNVDDCHVTSLMCVNDGC